MISCGLLVSSVVWAFSLNSSPLRGKDEGWQGAEETSSVDIESNGSDGSDCRHRNSPCQRIAAVLGTVTTNECKLVILDEGIIMGNALASYPNEVMT